MVLLSFNTTYSFIFNFVNQFFSKCCFVRVNAYCNPAAHDKFHCFAQTCNPCMQYDYEVCDVTLSLWCNFIMYLKCISFRAIQSYSLMFFYTVNWFWSIRIKSVKAPQTMSLFIFMYISIKGRKKRKKNLILSSFKFKWSIKLNCYRHLFSGSYLYSVSYLPLSCIYLLIL